MQLCVGYSLALFVRIKSMTNSWTYMYVSKKVDAVLVLALHVWRDEIGHEQAISSISGVILIQKMVILTL